jgi:hypothetical protein
MLKMKELLFPWRSGGWEEWRILSKRKETAKNKHYRWNFLSRGRKSLRDAWRKD